MLTVGVWVGHDAGVAILDDGRVVAAIAEERLDRVKHSRANAGFGPEETDRVRNGWPALSLKYCLGVVGCAPKDVDVLATNSVALAYQHGWCRPVEEMGHHFLHAVVGGWAAGWEDCEVLVMDQQGARVPGGSHRAHERESLWSLRQGVPHLQYRWATPNPRGALGLGLVYSAMARAAFPDEGDREGKLMALAGTSSRADLVTDRVGPLFRCDDADSGIETFDGSWWTQQESRVSLSAIGVGRMDGLRNEGFDWADIAAWVQASTEAVVVRLLDLVLPAGGRLVLSGGVALNCKLNGLLRDSGRYEAVRVPVAPGDSGHALGLALVVAGLPSPSGEFVGYTGRDYEDEVVEEAIRDLGRDWQWSRPRSITEYVASLLAGGAVVGWFQGSSELGPRALGARSLLANAADPQAVDRLNRNVKLRHSFQPVAPVVPVECVSKWFQSGETRHMMFAVRTTEAGSQRLGPVIHADGTCRLQTVRSDDHALFHSLCLALGRQTGVPVVANSSFNGKGEPIVETPEHAIRAGRCLGLDALALGPFVGLRGA